VIAEENQHALPNVQLAVVSRPPAKKAKPKRKRNNPLHINQPSPSQKDGFLLGNLVVNKHWQFNRMRMIIL